MIWGASKNSRTYWRHDQREALGWEPQDSADPYAGQLAGKTSGNPVEERYQGGGFASADYSRTTPAPKMFK